MALLNGMYIHVTDEDVDWDIEVTEHAVEQGADIADHINMKSFKISLSGKIVSTDTLKGSDVLGQIHIWKKNKTLLRYDGRNFAGDVVISAFSSSHPNTIMGGCEFSMELKELRIAKNAYVADENQQAEAVVVPNISVGEIVVFKGGGVYVSSDAKNKAATRNRSTCKITKISRKSWSIHQIHLISTDGGKVYGWVDESDIEGVSAENTETKRQTQAGRQQIT